MATPEIRFLREVLPRIPKSLLIAEKSEIVSSWQVLTYLYFSFIVGGGGYFISLGGGKKIEGKLSHFMNKTNKLLLANCWDHLLTGFC